MKQLMKNCEQVANLLKTLSHPKRLSMLCVLADGEKTVSDIEKSCMASQSAVSQFLKNMRLENLVDSRREGNYIYYHISDKKVLELIKALQKIYCK